MKLLIAIYAAAALLAASAAGAPVFPEFPDAWDRVETRLQFDNKLMKRWIFRTKAHPRAVADFYRSQLTATGWEEAGYGETELFSEILSADIGDVAILRKEDVRVHVLTVPVRGEKFRMGMVTMMFEWPMRGGMGSFGADAALYPGGSVSMRLEQRVGEGAMLFEQARCPDSPGIVLPHVMAMLAGSGWRENKDSAAMRAAVGFEDGIRMLARGNDTMAVLAAKADHSIWLYSFIKYENMDFERLKKMAEKIRAEPGMSGELPTWASECWCDPARGGRGL